MAIVDIGSGAPATRRGEDVSMKERLLRCLPLLVVALAAILSLRRLDNTDTWWHLAAGRWISAHHSVPATDPLSWTVPDHPWINVQWLFDVLIYGLHHLGGPDLLILASVLVYSAATALMLLNIRRYVGPVLTTALGAWATIVSQERFAIRPEMASYLLLQIMLWLYATGRLSGSKRLWLLPVVLCLWANTHSLFIVGAVVILSQMIGGLVADLNLLPGGWRQRMEPEVTRRMLLTGGVALAATALNPFFLNGALFPLVLMSRVSNHPVFRTIGELRRPFENYFVTVSITAYQIFFAFGIATVALALLVASSSRSPYSRSVSRARPQRRRAPAPKQAAAAVVAAPPAQPAPPPPARIDLADIAVFAGLAYLSILARRNMALFAMGCAPCIAACLAVIAARMPRDAKSLFANLERVLAWVLAPAILAAGWFVASNGFYRWNNELHECGLGVLDVMFPIRAAAFAKAQKLPTPLFNDFTNGGYLTWAEPLPGGVYVDGRGEVYDVDFLGPYMQYVGKPQEWQAEMDRRKVQTVFFFHWWPNHQALVSYLVNDPRWAMVYYDETSIVLVRREGNDEVIARATAAFPAARDATERVLLEPTHSWQFPVGRARGLSTYAGILSVMGKSSEAAAFQARLAELEPVKKPKD